MGSTDPGGEGGKRVPGTDAYTQKLREYQKRLQAMESANVNGMREDMAVIGVPDIVNLLIKAAPLIIKYAPLIAMGLRKSADQLDAIKALSDLASKANRPAERVEKLDSVQAAYPSKSVAEQLAERFGDIYLDMSDQPERHSRGEMIRTWQRWMDDLYFRYRGTADKLEWIGEGVPEFIPAPTDENPNRWTRNPAFDASGFTTLSVEPTSKVDDREEILSFPDRTTVQQRVGRVERSDKPEFTEEQIDEFRNNVMMDRPVGETFDLDDVRQYFEMKGTDSDVERTGNEIREREARGADPREG